MIYEWQIQKWSFETQSYELVDCLFDPTDDYSGERCNDATNNIISYVNEIDGKGQIANVSARHDPEGNVHYLLGHMDEKEGDLLLNENLCELLV